MSRRVERTFRAMGTDVHLVVVGDADLLDQAHARIQQLEQRWSRFLPTSELSMLNAAAGRETRVSVDTITLVRACATAWAATDGRFDPTLHHVIVALGYDRDFALLASGPARHSESLPTVWPYNMGDVVVDELAGTVRLPFGVGLDAGGLGKGLAADIVVAELLALGADGAMVNLGGDLAASGEPPDGDAWVVAVEDPHDEERTLCHVALRQGGIATSSILGRRWRVDGTDVHHLLDPATHRPTAGPLVSATVVAGQAWWAECLTKSMLVGGPTVSLPSASALVVDVDGHHLVLGEGADVFFELDGTRAAS
jgi:thiamine biosynthesis lipoprotein